MKIKMEIQWGWRIYYKNTQKMAIWQQYIITAKIIGQPNQHQGRPGFSKGIKVSLEKHVILA